LGNASSRKSSQSQKGKKEMKTSVVIPNWEGRTLLEKNLPSVLSIGADEVIVVENGSTDGSLELLQTKFPKVKTIINRFNEGFARGVNRGVKEAKGDIIILLNTDVIPQKNILKYVLPHFEDKKVFAVSFNEGGWSWAKGFLKNGLIEHSPGEKTETTHISFWASGGSAAFDRRKWNDLKGLNLIYEPFYWEDLDLGYRAQKRGWKVLWEPKALVEHKHEVTVSKHSYAQKKEAIAQRNQILFFWCNISSFNIWINHLIGMVGRLIHPGFWKPFIWAILKLPQVFAFRLANTGETITDEQVLNQFKN
jgi:GT2 family glycosyltransferase